MCVWLATSTTYLLRLPLCLILAFFVLVRALVIPFCPVVIVLTLLYNYFIIKVVIVWRL